MKKPSLLIVLAIFLTTLSIFSCKKNMTDSSSGEENINYVDYLNYEVNLDNTITITGIKDKELKKMVIPSTIDDLPVTSIGSFAFEECYNLAEVVLPDGLTSILTKAFYNCRALFKINIPDTITVIENTAFSYCLSLASIVIPENITILGDGAFSCCYQLVEVYNLSSIDLRLNNFHPSCATSYAKVIHKNLQEPSIVFIDGDYQLAECDSTYYLLSYLGNKSEITLPSQVRNSEYIINSFAFYNENGLNQVTINKGVTAIKHNAFWSCHELTEVILSNDITEIGTGSFANCYKLRKINLPENLEEIESAVFANCSSLYSITIPENIRKICDDSFSNCPRLCEVYNLSSLNISTNSFDYGEVGLHAYVIHKSLKDESILHYVDDFVLAYYKKYYTLVDYIGNSENVTIHPDIARIGYKALYKKDCIVEIKLSPCLERIDAYAFAYMPNLKIINYIYSMDRWNHIEKGYGWDEDTSGYIIKCKDGIISYD